MYNFLIEGHMDSLSPLSKEAFEEARRKFYMEVKENQARVGRFSKTKEGATFAIYLSAPSWTQCANVIERILNQFTSFESHSIAYSLE